MCSSALYSTSTSLNRLKKTTRNLTQNNQSLLQYSCLRALKCGAEVITIQLYSSVLDAYIHIKEIVILLINPSVFNQTYMLHELLLLQFF
jgi:hypothetical protein